MAAICCSQGCLGCGGLDFSGGGAAASGSVVGPQLAGLGFGSVELISDHRRDSAWRVCCSITRLHPTPGLLAAHGCEGLDGESKDLMISGCRGMTCRP